jgi:transposase
MRKIREVLRLHHACSLSKRKIAPLVGIGPTAVGDYLRRAREAGFGWPLPDDLDDEALERRLFPPPPAPIAEERPVPDWPTIARELRRKGVTLRLVWEEYRTEHQDGFGYSWFCDMYRAWQGRLSPTMRQEHRAGEKMFVDYAGQTMPIVTSTTGEVKDAEIFIAVLGASNFTFVAARWSQSLPDWIGAHVDAFTAIGGAAAQVVCDNLRSGVTKASRYEPALNPTYREMAEHYGTVIIPARPRKPRDKAKVEVGVQVVERWVLARLRNRTFFSLDELNRELRRLTSDLNARVMRHLGVSRRELFERLDCPALRPLPETPYEYAEWRRARVGLDYHIEVDARFYSVP